MAFRAREAAAGFAQHELGRHQGAHRGRGAFQNLDAVALTPVAPEAGETAVTTGGVVSPSPMKVANTTSTQ